MSNNQQDWFSSWFNTPYYHILYKDRNDEEAQFFIRNITSFLKLNTNNHILDLPCGKGRHSKYLNSLGYKVTGGDLSKNSIEFAKSFENERLRFKVKDMREPFSKRYDAIFNLFTSFGYFENDDEEIRVLRNMKNGLHRDGVLVLDFLNVHYTTKNLVGSEKKIIEGIEFHISREISDGFIVKHIDFKDGNEKYKFTERVKYLDLFMFKNYFEKSGFQLKYIFGDYSLNAFNANTSQRLIMVAH